MTIADDNDCGAGRRPRRRQTGDNAGNELVTERVELVGNDVTACRVKVIPPYCHCHGIRGSDNIAVTIGLLGNSRRCIICQYQEVRR